MGIGVSIFLIAVGAILAFAVEVQVSGINIAVVGWILIIVGLVGLALTLFVWGPRNRRATSVVEEQRVYRDDYPPQV